MIKKSSPAACRGRRWNSSPSRRACLNEALLVADGCDASYQPREAVDRVRKGVNRARGGTAPTQLPREPPSRRSAPTTALARGPPPPFRFRSMGEERRRPAFSPLRGSAGEGDHAKRGGGGARRRSPGSAETQVARVAREIPRKGLKTLNSRPVRRGSGRPSRTGVRGSPGDLRRASGLFREFRRRHDFSSGTAAAHATSSRRADRRPGGRSLGMVRPGGLLLPGKSAAKP